MKKTVQTRDGTEVVIRPMTKDDLERSFAFFQKLPASDRLFLRSDVTNRDLVRQRIRDIRTKRVKRLVATIKDEIVADGVLELEGHEWKTHVSEMRLIVARPYQRKGLGVLLARELYFLAAAAKVDEIVVKMMRPQTGARRIFRRLGFQEQVIIPDYVKDRAGNKQDLLIMRCDLAALWKEMEDYLASTDWQRAR